MDQTKDPNYFDVEAFSDSHFTEDLTVEDEEPALSELDLSRADYVDWSDVDSSGVFEDSL